MERNHSSAEKAVIDYHQGLTSGYIFEKIIGNGTYGTVFKAKCAKTENTVAIKFIAL